MTRSRAASLVVPNWNGVALLRDGLPTLVAAAKAHDAPVEILVVDDGSDDDSLAVLGSEFPEVRIERHDSNLGFGPACLTGVRAACHETVVLLNSDVRVAHDFLAPLIDSLADPEVFAASPLVFGADGTIAGVSLSVPYFRRGKIRYRRVDTTLLLDRDAEASGPWYTAFSLGAAVALDRARFLDLGGFDPIFEPFYYEDVDLGLRAWRRGWSCVVAPSSRVIHDVSRTIGEAFEGRQVAITRKRNRLLLSWKNLTTSGALASSFIGQLVRIAVSGMRLDATPLRATAAALPRLPAALRGRRRERAAACRSDAEVFARIEAAWSRNAARLTSDANRDASSADRGALPKRRKNARGDGPSTPQAIISA